MSSKRAATIATWELFEFALKIAQSGGKALFHSYGKMKLGSMPRSTYNAKLNRFKKFGLLEKITQNGKPAFIISSKAKYLRTKAVIKKLRSDGFATLIIFDIPQEKRNARDILRRFLLRNGFTGLRESSFISPFQISPDLMELIRELKLEKNISFFSAKPIYPIE